MSRTGLADELPELEASLLEDLSPRNVMRVADACRLAGRPERAVELLDVLLAERPAAIAPLVLKAWCLADLGRGEESAKALEELRAIDPANPWASGRTIPEPVLVSSEPQPEPAREPEPQPEPAAQAESEAELETEPEIEPGSSFELEAATAEVAAEVEPEPEVEIEAEADAEHEVDRGPELEEPASEEPLGEAFAAALAEEDDPEDEAPAAETPAGVVFEIPEGTTDLAAAVAAMADVELEQEPDSEPTAEPESEPEPAPEPEVEPEPPLEASEPEPEPAPAAFEPPDEEAEAEPERALTEDELADVPPSPLYSATLAEIFERQGFEEKAMEIYTEVVRTHPERVDLRERIAELERRLPAGPGA